MECPHLNDCVKITAPQNPQTEWSCSECKTDKNPWLCLTCGSINCGRYIEGHGLEHWRNTENQHSVCMDCDTLAVFCYLCDEFVINELAIMDEIRKQLQYLGHASSGEHEDHSMENERLGDDMDSVTDSSDDDDLYVCDIETIDITQSPPRVISPSPQVISIPPSVISPPASVISSSVPVISPSPVPSISSMTSSLTVTSLSTVSSLPTMTSLVSVTSSLSMTSLTSSVTSSVTLLPSVMTTSVISIPLVTPVSMATSTVTSSSSMMLSGMTPVTSLPLVADSIINTNVVANVSSPVAMVSNVIAKESSPVAMVSNVIAKESIPVAIVNNAVATVTSQEQIEKLEHNVTHIEQMMNEIQSGENRENQENQAIGILPSRRRKAAQTADNKLKKLKKTDENKSKHKPRSSGLRNLGNTCFMNAVLQSLSNIQSFCGYIKELPSLENKVNNKKLQTRAQLRKEGDQIFLVEELRKTLVALWQREKAAISPESLFSVIWKVVPRFRGYQQQDAHEFMRYLLDRLHTELLTLLPYPNSDSIYIGAKGKSTIVTNIFGGILQNEVRCLVCGMESKKHDPFLDLSLDIPVHYSPKSAKTKDGESSPQHCHLSDCLESFTDVEELEDSELYRCSQCKVKQRSTKRFWIRRLPNVLCLHLKRFRWNSYFRVKVDQYVEFPIKGLSMDQYVLDNLHETRNSGSNNEYDLAACVVHHGSGAGSGHYTSYASHEGRWYHFNDSTVTSCDEETVGKCKAYILFYVRNSLRLPNS